MSWIHNIDLKFTKIKKLMNSIIFYLLKIHYFLLALYLYLIIIFC